MSHTLLAGFEPLTAEDLLWLSSQGVKGELIRIAFQFRWHDRRQPVIPAKAGIQTPVAIQPDHLKWNAILIRGVLCEPKTELMLGERMATATTELLTAEDLLRLNSQGIKGELIRGVLCETVSAGAEHSFIGIRVGGEIDRHARRHRLGRVGGTDGGVLIQRGPDTVREPDVFFVSAEKLPLDVRVQGYLEVIPELVVEIVSPSDRQEAVNDKTLMWLSLGVLIVVEVYPAERAVMVHRPGASAVTLTGDDALDGGDVLPGFSLPLSEIFDA